MKWKAWLEARPAPLHPPKVSPALAGRPNRSTVRLRSRPPRRQWPRSWLSDSWSTPSFGANVDHGFWLAKLILNWAANCDCATHFWAESASVLNQIGRAHV